ncbi:MAG TPA: asparaginase [Desulfurococcaceae archaeon]|nr:asparaginase [Desulfurococcaceae archaeon]
MVFSLIHCEKPIIVVHGGAGRWDVPNHIKEKALEVLKQAAEKGYSIIDNGGAAFEAVVEAIKVLEDSELFNAGMGSVLNVLGEVEMDAGIMDGKSLRAAGVAAVSYPRNPIVLAKLVMEKTDHILIVGRGADRLAQAFGLEPRGEISDRIREKYNELIKNIDKVRYWKKLRELLPYLGIDVGGTVGAIALDREGNVAAGTSTGGIWLKLPGRVGDSPIPGAGFYADNRGGAASATGLGEVIISMNLTRRIVELLASGSPIDEACINTMKDLTARFGAHTAGVIALDIHGDIIAVHNTEAMPYAYKCKSRGIEAFFVGHRIML